MDSQSSIISSFVIRFVMNAAQDDPADAEQHPYRGSIRHIQSDEEMHFHLWEDAVEFIRRYVPLGTETDPDGS